MEIMEIITLDKAARQQVEAARRAADAIDAETPAEAQRLRDELYAKARQKSKAFEEQQAEAVARHAEQTRQTAQRRMQQLNDRYAQCGDAWLEHIVDRVTKE